MKSVIRLFPILLGMPFFLAAGCSPPTSLVGLNDKIAAATRKLGKLAQGLGKSLEPLKNDKPVEASGVKTQIESIGKTLEEMKEAFEYQSIPVRKSKSSEGLLTAFKDFLQVQDKIFQTHFQKVETILDNGDTPRNKWISIETELRAAKELERSTYNALRDAQRNYCEEHFFLAVPSR
jgi:hypothetical protein